MEPLFFEQARATNTVAGYQQFLAELSRRRARAARAAAISRTSRCRPGSRASRRCASSCASIPRATSRRRAAQPRPRRVQERDDRQAPRDPRRGRAERRAAAARAPRLRLGRRAQLPRARHRGHASSRRAREPTPDMDGWMRLDYDEAPGLGHLRRLDDPRALPRAPLPQDRAEGADLGPHVRGAGRAHPEGHLRPRQDRVRQLALPVLEAVLRARLHVGEHGVAASSASTTSRTCARSTCAAIASRCCSRAAGSTWSTSRRRSTRSVIDRYRREDDLSSWNGVSIVDDKHVLIYGPDGAELDRSAPAEKPVSRGRWEVRRSGRRPGGGRLRRHRAAGGHEGRLRGAHVERAHGSPAPAARGHYVGARGRASRSSTWCGRPRRGHRAQAPAAPPDRFAA